MLSKESGIFTSEESGALPRATVQRSIRHLNRLASLRAKEKLAYVYTRVVNIAKSVEQRTKMKVKRIITQVAYRSYEAFGHPVHLVLQDVKAFHRRITKNYEPQVYPGRLVVFVAREQPDGLILIQHWVGMG
jgi:Txe/YoeB family toxin of Txe-Axe toxin-antitoxin module